MSGWLSRLRAAVRSQLWPLPAMVVVLAVAVGLLLPRLDAHVDGRMPRWLSDLLFGGDAGAARTVLDAVASSLITVTSLTFSLTVVTLQLASSQFSPRLLRTFTRDLFVQATLALFLGTFAYSLAVLRSVRGAGDSAEPGAAFVPQIAVTLSFVLALGSVLGLVLFLAHLARQIRVETMLHTVHRDANTTVRQTLGEGAATDTAVAQHVGGAPAGIPARPYGSQVICASESGFLVHVDEAALLAAAVAADAVLAIDRHPGSFLVAGTPLAACWASGERDLTAEQSAELQRQVHAAVHAGTERTETQDIGHGLRQLTDVTIKALSPGINDPTTAVHALDHTSALLCELAGHDLGPRILQDDQGRTRVFLHRPNLSDLLDGALSQPRNYGAADPVVLGRLFVLLAEVGWCARPRYGDAILAQLDRLSATADAQDFDATETASHRALARFVRAAVAGEWAPPERG